MAKVNQKDRYRQRAALCYEIAATMFGDKAISMKRLGDIYAGLIEDFDKPRTEGFLVTGSSDRPKCVKCGKAMRHTYSLPHTNTLPAMQAFCCDGCRETIICKVSVTDVENGSREKLAEIRSAVLEEFGESLGSTPEQEDVSAKLDTPKHVIKPRTNAETKEEGEDKSIGVDANTAHDPETLDRPMRELLPAAVEDITGPEPPDTSPRIDAPAGLVHTEGDSAGARRLGHDKGLDPEPPETAASLDDLANLLYRQGDFAGARPLMERALTIKEKALGPEHPDTAAGLDNLANLLYSQGDLAGARPLLERLLTIRDNAFGPDDPNTNRVRYNYARLLSDMGHAAEALAQSQAARASHKKVLGPNHDWTKDSAGLSARLLFRHVLDSLSRPSDELLVDESELKAQLVEGPEVRPNSPPPQPPSTTGKPVGNEARRTRIIARSRTKKAQQNRRAAPAKQPSPDPTSNQPIASAEATCDAATDHEHPDTAASLYDFANLLHGQGDLAGAQPLYERALVIYDKVLGPEHPDTMASLNNLANLLHSQGDLEGARRLIERSLAIHDNAFGPEHPNTNRVRDNLVRLLSDMGHADEALARSQPGPGSNKKVLGPDHRESKVSAGVSTQHQRVVKGNEGHPYSPPSRSSSSSSSTTAKEVGIETKRARIFARSKPEKTQQSPLEHFTIRLTISGVG